MLTTDALNTLRLPLDAMRSLAQLLNQRDALDDAEQRGRGHRTQQRYSIDPPRELTIDLQTDGLSRKRFTVFARDLSAHGISLLHGVFVAPNTRCLLSLKTLDREPMILPGLIRRCRLVGGRVHELGVKFDAPIDPRSFLDLCQDDAHSEAPKEATRFDPSAVASLLKLAIGACDEGKSAKEIAAIVEQARDLLRKAA